MRARRLPSATPLVLLSLSLALGACRQHDTGSARLRAEQAVLERQVQGLEELVALAEQGALFPKDAFAIGVDEALVRDLLAAGLPQEQLVAERYRVRVERASVRFESNQSLITLDGRVSSLNTPGTYADLQLRAGLGRLAIEPLRGRLQAQVVLDHFEVRRAAAAGAESRVVSALIEELGRERLDAFEGLVPLLEIPVRLDQSLVLKGTSEGPVAVSAGELPVRVAVSRVIPLSGRLWVLLDISAGPWTAPAPEPPASPRPTTP